MNTFTLGLIVIAYLLSLAYLGFLGYKKTTNTSDYLVGGRQMNPIVMALSYGATFISASAIVGFGGVAAAFGMGIQWLCFLNMFVGVVIAFIFFGLRTRRMGAKLNVSTFPQLLGRHFRSRNIQVFIAAVIFIGMPLYAAVVMKGGAVFIEQIFQIDFNISLLIFTLVIAAYVIAGGMKGGDVYGCFTGSYHVWLYVVPVVLFVSGAWHGFYGSKQGIDKYSPSGSGKVQGIGASGMDRNACDRFSAVVLIGYLSYFGSRNRLPCTASVGGTFYDGRK